MTHALDLEVFSQNIEAFYFYLFNFMIIIMMNRSLFLDMNRY